MSLEDLAIAVFRQPDPPCNGCPYLQKCADEYVACERFYTYTEAKYLAEQSPPNAAWLAAVFPEDEHAHHSL